MQSRLLVLVDEAQRALAYLQSQGLTHFIGNTIEQAPKHHFCEHHVHLSSRCAKCEDNCPHGVGKASRCIVCDGPDRNTSQGW